MKLNDTTKLVLLIIALVVLIPLGFWLKAQELRLYLWIIGR